MFSEDFLRKMATTYGLTQEQIEVFLPRLLESRSHEKIAHKLDISISASLRRMAEVYKKFKIVGKGRGKDDKLRKFLLHQLEQYKLLNVSETEPKNGSLQQERLLIKQEIEKDNSKHNLLSDNVQSTSFVKDSATLVSQYIQQNLPAPTYTAFINRQKETSRLLELLSPEHSAHIITVHGIGGVGKTAFVTKVARLCLKARERNLPEVPQFDAIIFTSAKRQYLTPSGLLDKQQRQRNLNDIFLEIAHTLDETKIKRSPVEKQLEYVRQSLANRRTLLIVDNMETMEDPQEVMSFLYDLPANIKVVITSREQMLYVPIRLQHLSLADGLQLIQQQGEEKGVTLTMEESKLLYDHTEGVPIAIIYTIGQISTGYPLETVLEQLTSATDDLGAFCFQGSVQRIKEQSAYKLLMSIAIFSQSPIREAIAEVAGLTDNSKALTNGLARLQQLSLVHQQEGHYRMLALTGEYALAELASHQDFEQEARKRWVKWYLDFARKNGGDDWHNYCQKYDCIEAEWNNFIAVLDWCTNQGNYNQIKNLWLLLNKYANLYGYWQERLFRLNWLIEASKRQGDWITFVNVTTAKAWTLILMESSSNLKEAEKLLQEAWSMSHKEDLMNQYVIAQNTAVLYIRLSQYDQAREWFNRYKELVIANSELEDLQKKRHFVRFNYYHAEICYREKKYDQAVALYQQVVEQAGKIGWQRFVIRAQNWLANIAIKKGNLEEAEKLLKTGLPVAKSNKDKRRTALYQRSYARLEQKRGNLEEAREWANKAIDQFKRLGMQRDIKDMESWLKDLNEQ